MAYEVYRIDPAKTAAYAKESMDLSLKLDYPKGQAASLWVSGLLIVRSDVPQALDNFQRALKIAEEIGDKHDICTYLIAVAAITEQKDLNVSIETYERALEIAREIDDKLLIAKCMLNLSKASHTIGNYVSAVKYLYGQITILEQLGEDQLLARGYERLASIYHHQGNYPLALEYNMSALKINEKLKDDQSTMLCLLNIGAQYHDQNQLEPALETIQKALDLAIQRKDSMYISVCYTNIGSVYDRMNVCETALEYFQKGLLICEGKNETQTVNIYLNIGSIYTKFGEFDKAKQNLDKALVKAETLGWKNLLCGVYLEMGKMYLKQKRYEPSTEYTQKACDMAKEVGYVELQKNCQQQLATIYAQTGRFEEAYRRYVEYKTLYDSILNEKDTRKIALLESSYQFAKEREVYELEKTGRELRIKSQRQTILSLVVISLLILLLAVAVYWSGHLRKRVLKLKIENINRELEANQKAMAVAKLKLVQNSERDAHNVKMLEDIGRKISGESPENLGSMINNYKLQINHSNWEEFETLFSKVNASFWDKLNERCPSLTTNERKLCVFLKLNMSNKDIALITFQSEEALKKSRLRLRKKFDIDRSINLAAFIQNL